MSDSQEYERQLLDLIPLGSATKRVEICLLLGQQKRLGAVSDLISILDQDPEAVVRVAALRALGEIGDASAIHEIANVATNQKSPVSAVAQEILRAFEARPGLIERRVLGDTINRSHISFSKTVRVPEADTG